MKILIADDGVAQSPGLRGLFAAGKKSKNAKAKKSSGAAQVVVSCAPQTASRKRAAKIDCDCSGIDLSNQPEQLSAILDALGISLLNRGCNKEGGKLIEEALNIRRKAFGPTHPLTAASLNSYSRVLRERGDYVEAEETVRESLRINETVFGRRSLPVAVNLNELGVIELNQSRFNEAETDAKEGLAILDALKLSATDRNTTRLMDIRGRAEKALKKISDADKTFTELLALDKKQLGTTQHPKYATHLGNYAGVKIAQKDLATAEKYYRQAIDLYLNSLGRPCHPNLIDAYANLSALLRRKGGAANLKQAMALAQQALALNIRVRGEMHELVGNDYANLGRVQYALGDTTNAIASFTKALRTYESNVKRGRFDPNHVFIAESLTWKGRVLVESGRNSNAGPAEDLLERAVEAWPVSLGADSLGQAIASGGLGRALYLQKKDPARALALLQYSYPIVEKALGAMNPLSMEIEQWLKEAGGGASKAASSAS